MEGQDDSAEKSFEPTEKKLQDARKKGDVPKSQDLNATAGYTGLLVAFLIMTMGALHDAISALQSVFADTDFLARPLGLGGGLDLYNVLFRDLIPFFFILFGVPALFVVCNLIVQRSITFAPTKLAPKLNRISPISVAKQKFGRAGLFEWFKSFLKLVLFSAILGIFLIVQMEDLVHSATLEPRQVLAFLADLSGVFLVLVIGVSLVIGLVDFLFQHYDHRKKLMMSRKEIMDETKENEGDPFQKRERQQRARDRLSSGALKDIETADVVITNPTHYAVALHWDRTPGSAPKCVAKGVDEVALIIRGKAEEFEVPIHEDPPTARALHATTKIGNEIPEDLYQAVAAAVQFAERVRMKARRRVY